MTSPRATSSDVSCTMERAHLGYRETDRHKDKGDREGAQESMRKESGSYQGGGTGVPEPQSPKIVG